MADISKEINDFRTAVYGRDVRNSMISLAEKVNDEVETNTTHVDEAVTTANGGKCRQGICPGIGQGLSGFCIRSSQFRI